MQNTLIRFPKPQFNKKAAPFSNESLSAIIIGFGILIRLVQYLYNRSLWNDEAALALNILNRSYVNLFKPLDYEQGAPIGFLLIVKLSIQVFGNNEYALRLVPLLAAIASLFLFYQLAKRCIQRQAIPTVLTLFVSLNYLFYYATELKQYSTDVAVALLCCLMGLSLNSQKLNIRQMVIFSIVGAIAVWFSHPAIFVLTGVGACCSLVCLIEKNSKKTIKLLTIYSVWILSFTGLYFSSLISLNSSQYLITSWKEKAAFPTSLFDINWAFTRFVKLFSNPVGFPRDLVIVPCLMFVLGCISLLLSRRKAILLFLMSPIIITFFASYLEKYPFRSRLVLFLAPFIILVVAEGIEYFRRRTWFKYNFLIGNIVMGMLLILPVADASSRIVNPFTKEEIKPVISYVKSHQQPEDILYIYQRTKYQFRYYAEKYGYAEGNYIMGIDNLDELDGIGMSYREWERYKTDFNKLRGNQRVWIMISHINHAPQEHKIVVSHLNSMGKLLDSFKKRGAYVYLYDFSQP